jgi:hypothetical protein
MAPIAGLLAFTLTFAACSQPQAAPSIPSSRSESMPLAVSQSLLGQSEGSASWMVRDAKKGPLLYVSDGSNSVFVYTYPGLKLTGTLKNFSQPLGECVDKAGNIWIANFGAQEMVEYAHGGTKPISTLKTDTDHTPYSCSVDTNTGNLAVSTWRGGSGPGYVSIYKQAKGSPTTYSDSSFVYLLYLGYDPKGNLFLDGVASGSAFRYAELPKGKTKFTSLKLNKSVGYPGNVQFDGKYVTVGDAEARAVYRTSGGKVIGTTTLSGSGTLAGYFIDGSTVVGADDSGVELYPYPAGGSPTGSVSVTNPSSVAVSK